MTLFSTDFSVLLLDFKKIYTQFISSRLKFLLNKRCVVADYYQSPPIPSHFIWRKAHSLTGIWLVLFLMEHLFTNSQAALYFGENGSGFVSAVDWLKNLPYLQVIELTLLGIPFLVHGIWGVKYLLNTSYNSGLSDGSKPSLPQYKRNHAYTWQRITSWILLVGIIAHVVQMRFLAYPTSTQYDGQNYYMLPVSKDSGLDTLVHRLDFKLYDQIKIDEYKNALNEQTLTAVTQDNVALQDQRQKQSWLQALEAKSLGANEILIVTPSFGTAELMMVRDTFKSPLMIILYTGLVLAACFHAFNGLWTAMISWGVTLTAASQRLMRKLAVGLMVIITFLGLTAIWATYWINLYE